VYTVHVKCTTNGFELKSNRSELGYDRFTGLEKMKTAELRSHLAGIGCGRAETIVNIITLKTKLI
jgi:hypothetical protein